MSIEERAVLSSHTKPSVFSEVISPISVILISFVIAQAIELLAGYFIWSGHSFVRSILVGMTSAVCVIMVLILKNRLHRER